MATEEMKPESKKTEQKPKQQSPQVKEDLPLLFPYKSCSFKVSIHCEGCKRKVKKILTNIEGVYKVDIDVKEHKVTVIGIVSPEILLKKLHKSGKNAELLPEIPDPVETKPKPVDPKEKNKKKKKEEKVQKTDEATSSGNDKPESEKTDVGKCVKPESGKTDAGKCGSGNGDEVSGSVKKEEKEVHKEKDSVPAESPAPADSPSPAVEKKAEESGGASKGNVGKKKKKKGQNLNSTQNPTGTPACTQSLPPPTTDHDRPFNQINDHQILLNNIPPRHDMYPYPPPSYYAPQVMYGVSYNVAQPPVSVDTASYYTPPPPYTYAYMNPGYQPYDQNPYPSRPSDSFELFSDENPNGCSVM